MEGNRETMRQNVEREISKLYRETKSRMMRGRERGKKKGRRKRGRKRCREKI